MNLFPIRSFSAANAATAIQSGALSALLLVNVLWLTGGWGYSILQAGMATLPSPVVVALLAPAWGASGPASACGRSPCPDRSCGRPASASTCLRRRRAELLVAWVPAALLVAIGIAMTFPLVSAAAVVDVPPAQFSVASGVNNVGRQLGATIGVATLVAILGEGVGFDFPPGVAGRGAGRSPRGGVPASHARRIGAARTADRESPAGPHTPAAPRGGAGPLSPRGGELEMLPAGERAGRFHTAVFPPSGPGAYEILDARLAPVAELSVHGGEVTELDLRPDPSPPTAA